MENQQPVDDFFSEENEAAAAFFKFKEPGDAIKGTYLGKRSIPAKDIYPEQIGYELRDINGQVVVVALNINKKFVHQSMASAKVGQIVGFKFTDWFETDASKKNPNISKAKTIKVYLGDMDPAFDLEKMTSDDFFGN